MTGEYVALMTCADCKAGFAECPECVNSVRIDPATGYPPDVVVIDGKSKHNPNPNPEAVRRSVARPVCDPCVTHRNEVLQGGTPEGAHIVGVTMLAAERHRRHHRE
ncbi:hypothetical protein [Streptomyces sp. NPDC056937]|uniref:hypothetical protein n=1 Tax=Streptomyces sp. NPDC056937 TaxID=3345969 RepID=UPI00362B8464